MSVMLLVLLAVRKNYRAYPAFTFYIAMNLTQAALLYAVYRRWGFFFLGPCGVAGGSPAAMIFAPARAGGGVCDEFRFRRCGVFARATGHFCLGSWAWV